MGEQRIGVGDGLFDHCMQCALRVVLELRRIDRIRNRDVGLLQDVADALVRGGQRLGIRQLREFADRLEAAVEVEEGDRLERCDGLELLRCHALVGVVGAESVVEKIFQQRNLICVNRDFLVVSIAL